MFQAMSFSEQQALSAIQDLIDHNVQHSFLIA